MNKRHKIKAFTLAETLITLVIVGVVSAITVPAIINSSNDREYVTAKNKVRSSIGEAVKSIAINSGISDQYTTKEFTEKVLSKYLKIGEICDTAKECGFPDKIKRPNGTQVTTSSLNSLKSVTIPYAITKAADKPNVYGDYSMTNETTKKYSTPIYFIALDGIHMQMFYNPYCVSTEKEKSYLYRDEKLNIRPQIALDVACVFGMYDMNGTKGPNQVGKDIGLFGTLYNGIQSRAAAVLPDKTYNASINWRDAFNYCAKLGNDKYVLPSIDELTVIYLYRELTPFKYSSNWAWSSTPEPNSGSNYRDIHLNNGRNSWSSASISINSTCVKK